MRQTKELFAYVSCTASTASAPIGTWGLGFGTVGLSLILAILLVAFIIHTTIGERRTAQHVTA